MRNKEKPMVQGHCSTVNQRVEVVSRLIAHQGSYGEVTQLSQQIGTSRQTLYAWKGKGQQALEHALTPVQAKGEDEATVRSERAILTLLLEGHASYRGIQACLKELLGLDVSLGMISTIVQTAGHRAQSWLVQQVPGEGRVVALDEQYSSKRGEAYLNVVDAQSGQVWATLPPVAVDGESWTLALWYLHEQGVVCTGSVSDGGTAIHEALQTTKAISTHQRDVWHLLHLAGQVQARLERVVQDEEQRQLVIERHVLGCQTRRGEVQTVLDLLEEAIQSVPAPLQKEVQRVIKQVRLALPALLYFAEEVEAAQREAIAQVGEAAVGIIAWAWQRRKILGEQPQQLLAAMDPAWRAAAGRLLEVWNRAVRASSVVENWHSIVRPHLAVHRSLSAGMLALLAVWHNHRVAPRGRHMGRSPLQRSSLPQPSVDWLAVLGYAAPAA